MIQRIITSHPRTEKIAPALLTLLKGMRARYVIALMCIVVLSSVAYVGSTNIIEAGARSAVVINVSGRQRMLSQRIPMLAQTILSIPDRKLRMPLLDQFDESVELMKVSHAALIHGSSSMGLEALSSHSVRLVLYGEDMLLDHKLSLFIHKARKFSDYAQKPVVAGTLYVLTLELARSGAELLPILDRVVTTFEQESRAATQRLQMWQLGVFVATMAVLFIEGRVIFWPLNRELNRNFRLLLKSRQRARKALDEADRANRAKSEFLANMSHELRTPLNAINGFSELMVGEVFGPMGHANYQEYSTDILNSGRHLLRIIDDILDVAQIESGTIRLSEDVVDLKPLLEDVRTMFMVTAKQDGIEIKIKDFVAPQILADGERLRQIIINLVSNAVRFSHQGGTVSLSVYWDEVRGISVLVCDQGIGIHPDEQTHILDPFVQLEEAYSRRHGGSGLGLPICNSLMKLHGGSLVIESQPGQGTKAYAHFPASRTVLDS
ncbi:MAG: type IV pili methyl-accepting chemotaxis transducer N-terminal domain-containing protein [Magnetovibrio sp.]|nr:type IV pili methyl-accepting chemotaxis transducer N-terminal domain-containing protein [Magnetovibrio sp.]